MNYTLIVLCVLLSISLSQAKWCIQNITTEVEVIKTLSRTKISSTWFGTQLKTETYTKIDRVPIFKEKRMCCPGYVLKNDTKECVPTCSGGCPAMAVCTQPDICECPPGYVLTDHLCHRKCENCDNGRCDDSGKCECIPGYQKNPETSRCEPNCELACGGNAYCSAPDVCSCKYGFFGNSSDICQPWCKTECKNGQCVGPNNCACHQGFAKVDGLCIPDCHAGCQFGDCLDYGVCRCWPDYVFNSSTGSCEESSENQDISSTETSTFSVSESSTTIWTTSTSTTTTTEQQQPTNCDSGCWGGICVNGVCQCPDGLILSDGNDCIMPCEATCKNGLCTQDKVCECLDGYVHKNDTGCVPQCDRECVNSFCIAPNFCECLEGYIADLNPLSAHICLPTCDGVEGEEGCLNGTCVAVNKCKCFDGFVHKPDNRFECILPTFMERAKNGDGHFWYLYLLLGIFILLVMCLLGLYALRKMHQDTYNVGKVEAVRYRNNEQVYCDI